MKSEASLKIFRFLAGFVSVYHFVLGLIGTFASTETIVWVVNRVYGVVPTVDAQFVSFARFVGIYMIIFAIAMALLAWKPVKYRQLVWLPITLFTVRVIERLAFFSVLQSAYKIDMSQNLRVIIPIAVLAVALFYLKPIKSSVA